VNDNCIQSDTTNITKVALHNKLNDHVTDLTAFSLEMLMQCEELITMSYITIPDTISMQPFVENDKKMSVLHK
jgi:hypothetical protein